MQESQLKKLPETQDDYIAQLIRERNGMLYQDPYRYSQGQIKHIRDALAELSKASKDAKKVKLEELAISFNSILEAMRVSGQEFVYIKGKLN